MGSAEVREMVFTNNSILHTCTENFDFIFKKEKYLFEHFDVFFPQIENGLTAAFFGYNQSQLINYAGYLRMFSKYRNKTIELNNDKFIKNVSIKAERNLSIEICFSNVKQEDNTERCEIVTLLENVTQSVKGNISIMGNKTFNFYRNETTFYEMIGFYGKMVTCGHSTNTIKEIGIILNGK